MRAGHQNQITRSSGEKPPELEDTRTGFWESGLLGAITLCLILYVSAYVLLVRSGATIWFSSTGKKILVLPDYRGVPPQIFAPIHYLDCNLIRPQFWGVAGRTWTVQKQNVAIANWPPLNRVAWTNTTGGNPPHSKPKPEAGGP